MWYLTQFSSLLQALLSSGISPMSLANYPNTLTSHFPDPLTSRRHHLPSTSATQFYELYHHRGFFLWHLMLIHPTGQQSLILLAVLSSYFHTPLSISGPLIAQFSSNPSWSSLLYLVFMTHDLNHSLILSTSLLLKASYPVPQSWTKSTGWQLCSHSQSTETIWKKLLG